MLFKGLKIQNEMNKKNWKVGSQVKIILVFQKFVYILKGLVHFAVGKIIKF